MRLIDADILLEQMKRRNDYVGRASDAVCLVEDAPTIEAEPIKKAKDVCIHVPYHCEFKCSLCGAEILCIEGGDAAMNFCPNCGAKMECRE